MVTEITSIKQFDETISEERTLVDTYAIWCGPCQMLSPIVEDFASKHREINVVKVDIDQLQEIAEKYSIMAVPTLLYFERGNLVERQIGYVGIDVIEKICHVN